MDQIRTRLVRPLSRFLTGNNLARTLPEFSDTSERTFQKPKATLRAWTAQADHGRGIRRQLARIARLGLKPSAIVRSQGQSDPWAVAHEQFPYGVSRSSS
jgi:hypothetical protein